MKDYSKRIKIVNRKKGTHRWVSTTEEYYQDVIRKLKTMDTYWEVHYENEDELGMEIAETETHIYDLTTSLFEQGYKHTKIIKVTKEDVTKEY